MCGAAGSWAGEFARRWCGAAAVSWATPRFGCCGAY